MFCKPPYTDVMGFQKFSIISNLKQKGLICVPLFFLGCRYFLNIYVNLCNIINFITGIIDKFPASNNTVKNAINRSTILFFITLIE